jgi:hypothetical protein
VSENLKGNRKPVGFRKKRTSAAEAVKRRLFTARLKPCPSFDGLFPKTSCAVGHPISRPTGLALLQTIHQVYLRQQPGITVHVCFTIRAKENIRQVAKASLVGRVKLLEQLPLSIIDI